MTIGCRKRWDNICRVILLHMKRGTEPFAQFIRTNGLTTVIVVNPSSVSNILIRLKI